jgi:hypothetical protein
VLAKQGTLAQFSCPSGAKQGTLAQFSCPGGHAQNGVAERKHRDLLKTARGLMIRSSIPHHFWVKAISTVAYLINIQLSSTLQGGIPFERLCGRHLITLVFILLVVCVMCFLHLVSALS